MSQQGHANDTHTVGLLQHTRMKENIPTPARADQLGDGKVTKLWHKAAAPIPGLGYNYIARTTVAFNGPGPSEFRPRTHVSVFMCWLALLIQILGRSSLDLGDLTQAGRSCQINYQSTSFPSPVPTMRGVSRLSGVRKPTLLSISTSGPRGRTTPTPAQSIWPSALRFSYS